MTTAKLNNYSNFKQMLSKAIILFFTFFFFAFSNPTIVRANPDISFEKGEVQFGDKVGKDTDIYDAIGTTLAKIISFGTGIATLVMVGMALINISKIATSGTNSKERTEAIRGLGWTLFAAVVLGSLTMWVQLALNTGQDMQKNALTDFNSTIINTGHFASVEEANRLFM